MTDPYNLVETFSIEEIDEVPRNERQPERLWILRLLRFASPEKVWYKEAIALGAKVLDLPVPSIRAGGEAVQYEQRWLSQRRWLVEVVVSKASRDLPVFVQGGIHFVRVRCCR